RAAQRVGQRGTRAHQAGRGQRGVGGPADRRPATRADERHRVVAELPGPAVHGGRRSQRQAGQHPRGGEHVRDHPVPAVLGGEPGPLPLRPHPGQVIEQRRVVHGPQDLVAVRGGRHRRRPGRGQRVPQHQHPFRDFGAGVADAQPHLAARIVAQAVLVPYHRHRQLLRHLSIVPDMEPPVAPAQDGTDPYAWMRDTSDPALLAYLAAERAYYDQQTAHGVRLRDALAAEMSARLAPADESAGWELGGWHYFTRTRPGLNYEQFCRRSLSGAGPEQVLLDENLLLDDPACGAGYVALGVREVSPDGRLLAYSADFDGDEVYQLRIRDLATGTDLPERMERSYYGLAWSADSRSVFYTVTDPMYRPYQVWRHDVGTAAEHDVCVFTEDDERFEVFVRASRSGAVIFIECESRDTTETWTIAASQPRSSPMIVQPRRRGTEYRADHGDGDLYIVTNDDATEFRLVKA